MASIEIFKNESFGEVRVTGTSEEPLFCLADLCRALDLQNPTTVKNRLDSDDVQLIDLHALNLTEGSVGNTKANFVTESGFYDVILQSSSPKVKPFRKWITSEVLPTIRKTGQYSVKKQSQKRHPSMLSQVRASLEWVKGVCAILNLGDAAKLALLERIAAPLNLPLPEYVPSKGIVKSATELLAGRNARITARCFNRAAVEKGYLCEKDRSSSGGKRKSFKCITEKGLPFGENHVNPKNASSTQPLWYEEKFDELLVLLGIGAPTEKAGNGTGELFAFDNIQQPAAAEERSAER